MRDEYFYDYSSTIFAYNDANYIELSAKLDTIFMLIKDDEVLQDKVLELLYNQLEEKEFNYILQQNNIERDTKGIYSMNEDELKDRLLDMQD